MGTGREKQAEADLSAQVVVVGSGGGGLAAALAAAEAGADVLVLEAAPGVGGSTLFSGALAWVPCNHLQRRAGLDDSPEEVLAYLEACLPGRDDQERWEAFVRAAPQMLRFLEEKTPLRFKLTPAPDSFAEKQGGKPVGRNVEPLPLSLSILGDWAGLLWDSPYPGPPVTLGEAFALTMKSTGGLAALVQKAKLGPALLTRTLTRKKSLGVALIIGLLKGCRDLGVRVEVNCRARDLVLEQGRVVGLLAEQGGRTVRVGAEKAVILASGGFEWNPEMVEKYLPGPVEYAQTTPFAQGDGQLMAERAGAELARMDESMVWTSAHTPDQSPFHGRKMGLLLNSIVNNPHTMVVNSKGRRFVNEPSHNAPQAFQQRDSETGELINLPAWSIFDNQFRGKYAEGSLGLKPGKPDPVWLLKGDTIEGLARKAGIDPRGLAAQTRRFNNFVREGKDLDFGRGESYYDRHFVPNIRGNPNLGTIEEPPFYAVRLHPGSVGTKGGPATDAKWRVLDKEGNPIPGLLAAGTVAATMIGPVTVSSSSAVGLILTQGFIAGRAAVENV